APPPSAPSGTPTTPAAPGAAPAPAEATPGAPNPNANANTGAAYTVRLHDLERRMDELKEQVYRSKARLNLLKETVLHGVIAGSRSAIVFKNEMGGMYVPVKYTFALD